VERALKEIRIEKRRIFIAHSTMGFRPSESRRLDVSDLRLGERSDLSDAYIALPGRKSKVGKGRMLQLSDSLRAWFRDPAVEAAIGRLEDRFGAEPLFINPDARKMPGKRWGEGAERKSVARACKLASVDHIAPNDLGRHAFATNVVADSSACKTLILRGFMGWTTGFEPATPGITIRCSNQLSYAHHTDERLKLSVGRAGVKRPVVAGVPGIALFLCPSRAFCREPALRRSGLLSIRAGRRGDLSSVAHRAPVAQQDRAAAF
jgi:hypothetical protein